MRRTRSWLAGAVCLLVTACSVSKPPPGHSATLTTARTVTSPIRSASVEPRHSEASATPRTGRLASPDYTGSGTAHGCGGSNGPVTTLVVDPDVLEPGLGCVRLTPGQRLRIVNNTNGFGQKGGPVTLSMRGMPTIHVKAGSSAGYPKPISAYLAAGQHYGSVASVTTSNFVLWVLR